MNRMFTQLADNSSTDLIPGFAIDRINWAAEEGISNNLSFIGVVQCLFAWDKEAQLRQNFELFGQSAWMPFSCKYIDWMLEDSRHQVMVIEMTLKKYKEGKGIDQRLENS